jgi:hypothetical protein
VKLPQRPSVTDEDYEAMMAREAHASMVCLTVVIVGGAVFWALVFGALLVWVL